MSKTPEKLYVERWNHYEADWSAEEWPSKNTTEYIRADLAAHEPIDMGDVAMEEAYEKHCSGIATERWLAWEECWKYLRNKIESK